MKYLLSFLIALLLCTTATTNLQAQTTDTTITTKVKGICCSSELKLIQTNVEKLEGVSECKVIKQGTTTSFNIQYNPTQVAEKDLYAAIEGTGGCKNPDARPYKVKGKK